jgi:hypothetical protein
MKISKDHKKYSPESKFWKVTSSGVWKGLSDIRETMNNSLRKHYGLEIPGAFPLIRIVFHPALL